MPNPYDRHKDFSVSVEQIGAEKSPVVVIDNFVQDPQTLVEYADGIANWPIASTLYPGVRAPCPKEYDRAVETILGPFISDVFGGDGVPLTQNGMLSLVTKKPNQLLPAQRIPHFDGTDPNAIAILHYLCAREKGGTGFFRHRETGFETVTVARMADYSKAMQRQAFEKGMPSAKYLIESDDMFERIAAYESVFNRVLIYRGTLLHSGLIPKDFSFDSDVREGRLTANTFWTI